MQIFFCAYFILRIIAVLTKAVGRELRSDARRERNRKGFPCQQVYRLPFGGTQAEDRERRPSNMAAWEESPAKQRG